MQLVVDPRGTVRAVYAEMIDLATLGRPDIARASHVEPDADGRWAADLSPVGGPTLGPFLRRGEALAAETAWLEARLLTPQAPSGPQPAAVPPPGPHPGDAPEVCPVDL